MENNPFVDPRIAQLYELENGWAADQDFYMTLAEDDTPLDICDLGCGTGLLTLAFAKKGHRVVGVDPAAPMLDVARQKADAGRVRWVESTAQAFRSETVLRKTKRFDLQVMSGHAWQVFLTDEDVHDVLSGMKANLRPNGRIAFESRNPLVKAWEGWMAHNSTRTIDSPWGQIRCWEDVTQVVGEYVTFESHNLFLDTGEDLVATSTLRFMPYQAIVNAAQAVGLTVENVYGYWDRRPFTDDSREMIFILRHAN